MRKQLMDLIANYNFLPVFAQLEKDGVELVESKKKFDFWENHKAELIKSKTKFTTPHYAMYNTESDQITRELITTVDSIYKD